MTTNPMHRDSLRSSSSSIIIHDNYKKKSVFLSWCCCSHTYTNTEPLLRTVNNTNEHERKSFFKRIQIFKGLNVIF